MTDEIKDLKKTLGYVPKVTFVIGGSACGKEEHCKKLVEEFGYQYLKVGDLLRAEAEVPSKEGERLKKIINDGTLAQPDQTVAILVNGMIANPADAYLIDGFPRNQEQATMFEQNVLEAQKIIYFEMTSETMKARCAKRYEKTGLPEHSPEMFNKKIAEFDESTRAMIEYYDKFGKVRRVDASGNDNNKIFDDAKQAALPQIMLIMGAKCSGKTTIATEISEKTYMKHIKFNDYLASHGITEEDDDTKCSQLTKDLSREFTPRVIIEDFP